MRATLAKRHSTGLLQETSVQMGVSPDRLNIAVRAAQVLGDVEIQFLEKLLRWIDSGVSQERRTAMSRGLARALEATPASAPADPLAAVDDPLDGAAAAESIALAEMESQTLRESILRDCLDAAEAGRFTGRSRQALERLRRNSRVLALRVGSRWRYPRWQFDPDAPGGIVPGLAEVLRDLSLSPTGAAFWLLQPSEWLGGHPPIEHLRRHRPEPVIELARQLSLLP
jgi:hypothetical protein